MARKSAQRRGAALGAPKPKIEPRKTPLTRRRWFRWTALVVVLLFGLWLGLFLWGRSSRANVLRVYDRALNRAQTGYLQHTAATLPDSFATLPQQFQQGQATPERLKEAARTWQQDFADAADAVRALDPPEQLEEANQIIAESLTLYAEVAAMYIVLADERSVASVAEGSLANRLQGQVDALGTAIQATRNRADSIRRVGIQAVNALKLSWGIASSGDLVEQLPTDTGGIPLDLGTQGGP